MEGIKYVLAIDLINKRLDEQADRLTALESLIKACSKDSQVSPTISNYTYLRGEIDRLSKQVAEMEVANITPAPASKEDWNEVVRRIEALEFPMDYKLEFWFQGEKEVTLLYYANAIRGWVKLAEGYPAILAKLQELTGGDK
jgi:hypothetical protein